MRRSYRQAANSIGAEEMGRVVGTTWKSMGPQDKAPYERVASEELGRYMDAKRTFEALHRHYSTLHYGAQEAGWKPEPHITLLPSLVMLEQGQGDVHCWKLVRYQAHGSGAGRCHLNAKRCCATDSSLRCGAQDASIHEAGAQLAGGSAA